MRPGQGNSSLGGWAERRESPAADRKKNVSQLVKFVTVNESLIFKRYDLGLFLRDAAPPDMLIVNFCRRQIRSWPAHTHILARQMTGIIAQIHGVTERPMRVFVAISVAMSVHPVQLFARYRRVFA